MNRRQFIRTAGVVSAGIALGGCSGSPDAAADTTDTTATTDDPASIAPDVSVAVVRNASEDPEPYEDPSGTVVPQESDALALEKVIFQRAGERGVVVSGDVVNTADRPFESVAVEVTLYDEDPSEEAVAQSTKKQTTHGRLGVDRTWQWATTFDEPDFEIDYYAVEATAGYD